jgi:hypothetical protein
MWTVFYELHFLCLKFMFSDGEKYGTVSYELYYLCSRSMFSVFCELHFLCIFFALRSMFADGQTWEPREVGKFSLAHAGFVGRLQAKIARLAQAYGVLSDKL